MLFEERIMARAPFFGDWEPVKVISSGEDTAVLEIRRQRDGMDERCALKAIHYKEKPGELPEELKSLILLAGKPNVIGCFDHALYDAGEGADLLLREELLTPVSDLEKSGFRFDESELIRLGTDISRALESCGKAGIVHGDIKSANIFRDAEGCYKLGDFGSATLHGRGKGLAAEAYAAPEQTGAIPGKADARTDVYGLGLTLYELAGGGRLPFAESPFPEDGAVKRRLSGEELPRLEGVSGGLDRAIRKACAFRPAKRYRSAAKLREALEGAKPGKNRRTALLAALCVLAALAVTAAVLVHSALKRAEVPAFTAAETELQTVNEEPDETDFALPWTEIPEPAEGPTGGPTPEPTPRPDGDAAAEFANPEFERLLREQYGFTGEILNRDLWQTAYLMLWGMNGWENRDLSDLKKFRNLEALEIYDAEDFDPSCLEGLANLSYLEISESGLTSLETMPELPRLQTLYIRDDPITELSGIERYGELTFLDITRDPVTDVTPIASLKKLRTLALTGCGATELSPLLELPALENLVVDDIPIGDLGALAPLLPRLRSLRADGCGLTSIEPLAAAAELHTLSVRDNAIADISALFGLPKLYYCYMGGNPVPQQELDRLESITETHPDPMD